MLLPFSPFPHCLALSFVGSFQPSWNYLSATGGGWVVWDLGSPHSVLAVFIMVYLKVSSNGCNGFNTFNTQKKGTILCNFNVMESKDNGHKLYITNISCFE